MKYKDRSYHQKNKCNPTLDSNVEFDGDGAGFTDGLPDEELERLRNKMLKVIQQGIANRAIKKKPKNNLQQNIKYAAVFVSCMLLTVLSWRFFHPEMIQIETLSDEIKEVILPDGSSVTLNEQSSLEYMVSWNGNFDRQVVLEGEAFFEISKGPSGQEFSINKGQKVSIDVLGTSFNFKKRNQKHTVALMTGAVKMKFSEASENLLLKPGELVSYELYAEDINIKKPAEISVYSAWKKGKLQLSNETLSNVLEIIAELYDLEVSNELVNDNNSTIVSGTLPLGNDAEEIIENLSILYEMSLFLENNIINTSHVLYEKHEL